MDIFWADINNHKIIAWDELFNDLNNQTIYNPYCSHSGFYEVFRHIILSLLIGEEIILLDSDFSNEEVRKLTGYTDLSQFNEPIEKKLHRIMSKSNLISEIYKIKNNWQITLFTSGTTGLPKKVKHSFQSITRFVKVNKNNGSNIWGFAYNPTHMAGIQVFFQALLNGNPIIKLFGLAKDDVFKAIAHYKITHISATPTFYRLLLPADKIFTNVERITSGGEKFDIKTTDQLTRLFPRAKITNVYASTEAGTLFASNGDVFTIKPEFTELVKIENNELHIHRSLLGETEFNSNEWYQTGDLVEVLSKKPLQFRFFSRKNELINVGGYKVNPVEVEETLRGIEGIKDARVFSKTNSVLGNIICCEIVLMKEELEEHQIRSFLQTNLQEYKIPRIMKFVEELSTTHTGKIKRV